MRFAVSVAIALVMATSVLAQESSQADRVAIELSSFKFTPSTITLEHGRPYVLHLSNKARGSHNFVAKTFFAAADVAPADRARLSKGGIEVDGGDQAEIHFTAPSPGRYEVHCSHFMHTSFGMKGEIIVR
jgi:uncharacterized cupredoxin-like copper-binding protein